MDAGVAGENAPSSLTLRFEELLGLPAETRNRDNKGPVAWPSVQVGRRFRLGLVRDIMAMSNTAYGGVIVVGVRDKTHDLDGLDDAQVGSWDQSALFEAVTLHASPAPNFRVERSRFNGKWFVAIEVEEFDEIPCVCRQEGVVQIPPPKLSPGAPRSETVLRRGALYIRTEGAQTVEIDHEALTRDLIARAMTKKGDHLLRQIQALVTRAGDIPAAGTYVDQTAAAKPFLDDV